VYVLNDAGIFSPILYQSLLLLKGEW